MFGKQLLVVVTCFAGLTAACGGQSFLDRRQHGNDSEEESLELTSKRQKSNYDALLNQATSHFALKGGNAPKKTVDPDAVIAEMNRKLPKSSQVRKPSEPHAASLNLAAPKVPGGTQTSQTITPEQICEGFGYAVGTPEYDNCLAKTTATIGTGINDWTYDPALPAVRVTNFPLTIPGYGSGQCVYARISLLAVGIACGNSSGGAWAGCDVWNGCGSGTF